jgi:hypothetical protein
MKAQVLEFMPSAVKNTNNFKGFACTRILGGTSNFLKISLAYW